MDSEIGSILMIPVLGWDGEDRDQNRISAQESDSSKIKSVNRRNEGG